MEKGTEHKPDGSGKSKAIYLIQTNILFSIYTPRAAPPAINKIADLSAPFKDSELIVLGDFNLNWLSSASEYLKVVCGNNLSQVITAPTMPNLKDPSKSSLVELILTQKRKMIVYSSLER